MPTAAPPTIAAPAAAVPASPSRRRTRSRHGGDLACQTCRSRCGPASAGCSAWRRSWPWCSSTVLARRHSHRLRSTGRPQPRHPRPGVSAAASSGGDRRAARPPITCGPPATMPCFGYTISCATPICRPDTLPRSVRCRRCVWSRSTGWWRSGWPDGGSGFIDAARLAPGDRVIARRAYCAYNAGPSPRNGEVLGRHGDGAARIEISNRGPQPVMVKLRDASGQAAATVFVAPGNSAIVENLPDTVYRPEFATGELWSGACNSFAAGMRAQRLHLLCVAVRTVAAGDPAQAFRRSGAGGYFRRGVRTGMKCNHGCTRMHTDCPCGFIRVHPSRSVISIYWSRGSH